MSYGEKWMLVLLILGATSDASGQINEAVRVVFVSIVGVLFINWHTIRPTTQEMGAGDWVRLEDLPPGMIFATQDGILAVKSEYYGSTRQCMCILLESGEYAHFEDGNDTLVTALELQRPTTAPDGEK